MQAIEVDADLWSDANLRDPFPLYAELRRISPVVRLARHDAYAVTRYDEVRSLLQDWESFTSAKGVGMSPLANARGGRGVISSDPPIHTLDGASSTVSSCQRRSSPTRSSSSRARRRVR